MTYKSKKKKAFVFAGGGSLGALQVGMLKALVKIGIIPDICVGASAGALNASFFAAHPDLNGVLKLESIWKDLKKNDIFPFNLKSLYNFFSKKDYLASPDNFKSIIENKLEIKMLEDSQLETYVIATNALSGKEVVISKGDIVKALLASSAIPAVFPPVNIDANWLIDGGVSNNTPVSSALDLGAEEIIVLPTGFSCDLPAPPKGAVGIALHSLNLLIARNLLSDISKASDAVSVKCIPGLCPLDVSPFDFSKTAELIDKSEAITEAWLNSSETEKNTFPVSLTLHSHIHN